MGRLVRVSYWASLAISALSLTVMSVWTAADVFMRYIFAQPLFGTGEITQFLLAFSIFAGLVVISRDREHIRVSLFEGVLLRVAPGLYRGLYSIVNFVGALAVFAILVWKANATRESGDLSMVLEWPLTIVTYGVAALAGLAALAAAYVLLRPDAEGFAGRGPSSAD
jgi:TRAP-type C4-dicarboxylate transport system permease small subunit